MDRNSISSNVERNQIQRSGSPECQDRPGTSQERLQRIRDRNTRFSSTSDSPSASNTDHPMPASELDQPRDHDHPQPEGRQDMLRNMLRRIRRFATLPCRSCTSALDAINDFYMNSPYEDLWGTRPRSERPNDNPEGSIPNREKIQEMLNIKLDGVKNGTWNAFGKYIVNKYDPIVYDSDGPRESSDTRLLSDVLQGGSLIGDKGIVKDNHVDDNERNSKAYKDVKSLVSGEWKMYNAGALLGIDLSEVRPERWSQFSHDLLEKHEEIHKTYSYLTDILRGYTADYAPDDGHLKADHVSDEERKSPAYKDLMHLASDKWEEWKIKKAGALLGRDLSEVRPERWAEFSNDVLSPYKDQDEDKHMLLKDILQGGVLCVKDETRKSEAYSDLIFTVRQKLEKQAEKRNNE